jgi:Flp pilus assembly protein TadG
VTHRPSGIGGLARTMAVGLWTRIGQVLGAARAAPPGRARRADCGGEDDGNAIVEFVFVAVLVLIPLAYLIVAVASIQRSRLAVTDAARDVGRAIATADSADAAAARAGAALRIALANEGLAPDDVELRYVAADAGCSDATVPVSLAPAAEFAVCVTRHQELPAVPTILSGRGVTTVGRYVVHVDDFRATG